ncbi:MAG: MBL fold metallo-hydrolase [Chloroflexi bacterium]|nr:MAG: MBL fold metallo-hydrolase [Chloroflexota bacterium]
MLVRRVVANNPGPYTGPGTNTWILGGEPVAAVIDPGPDDDAHLAAIETKLGGAALVLVLVTHSHPDHLPLAGRLAERHQARLARYPELGEGDIVTAGKVRLKALYTPGHASDHLCFLVEEDRAVFTGDLVLGQGSTMITYPDGDMAAYLRSLEKLIELRPSLLFPGHFDPIQDSLAKLEEYRAHRLDREAQVLRALESGPGEAPELTQRVYGAEVSGEALLQAAEMTLKAHLHKLVQEGRVGLEGSRYSLRS